MNKFDLDTPSLLIDFNKLENNIAQMQKIADDNHVKLRPHTKTHKTPYISHMQIRAGARGITCAKLGEAEVMNAAGVDDILIAFPLQGASKMERLLRLAERAQMRVSLDSIKVAQDISDAASQRGMKIPFYVEVDPGLHRVGLPPREATRDFVRAVTKLPEATRSRAPAMGELGNPIESSASISTRTVPAASLTQARAGPSVTRSPA